MQSQSSAQEAADAAFHAFRYLFFSMGWNNFHGSAACLGTTVNSVIES